MGRGGLPGEGLQRVAGQGAAPGAPAAAAAGEQQPAPCPHNTQNVRCNATKHTQSYQTYATSARVMPAWCRHDLSLYVLLLMLRYIPQPQPHPQDLTVPAATVHARCVAAGLMTYAHQNLGPDHEPLVKKLLLALMADGRMVVKAAAATQLRLLSQLMPPGTADGQLVMLLVRLSEACKHAPLMGSTARKAVQRSRLTAAWMHSTHTASSSQQRCLPGGGRLLQALQHDASLHAHETLIQPLSRACLSPPQPAQPPLRPSCCSEGSALQQGEQRQLLAPGAGAAAGHGRHAAGGGACAGAVVAPAAACL